MHIGLLYAVVAFVGLCIIGIILNRTRATKYKETVDQPFCILLVFFLFFCLVDGIWGIFFANEGVEGTRLGYAIFTYGFHYMAGFSAFVWAGYLIRYTQIQKPWRTGLHIIRGGLLTSQLIVLTSNIWTGEAFSFTAAGAYQPGPIRSVLFWLQFTYYIILTVVGLLCLVLDKDPKARVRYRAALIFAAIPLIAGIFQRIYPDAPM